MNAKGIVIEQLSVTWFQVLTATFIIGGFAYSSISAFNTSKMMEEKYVPIINKLVISEEQQVKTNAETTQAYEKLDATLTQLNESIIAMTAVKEIEAKDVQNIKDDMKDLNKRVTKLETTK